MTTCRGGSHGLRGDGRGGRSRARHARASGGAPRPRFALAAIEAGAVTASELGRRLGVSKQAAAKTIATLQNMGYVDRQDDPDDGRRQLVRVTERGHEMVAIGGALFDDVRTRWADQVGMPALTAVERHLGQVRPRTVVTEELTSGNQDPSATEEPGSLAEGTGL